jgi:two-component system, cell cycle response regulator
MRAYYENDTIIKIEYTDHNIFMVTAIPIELRENRVVVELLQDVTKSMVLDDTKLSDRIELKKLLDKANAAVAADELTGVYNKRYIMEKLPVEIIKAYLENEPLSVVLADIDFFKKINDTYGHLAGDYIIKEFAKILQNNIRQEKDWVARFGGKNS